MKKNIEKYSNLSGRTLSYGRSCEYPPLKLHQMHAHEKCEILHVYRGNGYYITEGSRHKLEPGKIFLMRSGETHRPDVYDSEPYDRMSIHFDPEIVDFIDPERRLLAPFFSRPLGEDNVYTRESVAPTGIYRYIDKIISCKSTDDYDKYVNCMANLFSILSELCTLFEKGRIAEPARDSEAIREIVDYITHNLESDLSIDIICEKFFISRSQLNRAFKRFTGTSVWEYIVLKRLMLARGYLEEGMRANEVSSACGFRDYSSFYRAYLKKYGETPTGAVRK